MPVYKYRAKKGAENVIEDTIEAQSEKEAIERLIEAGYIPVRIQAEVPEHPDEFKTQPRRGSSGRIRSREITVFSRQLASLLRSGVPILNSIGIISEQSENPNLRNMLYDIHNSVKDGSTFSSSLMQFPKAFSPLYIALVRSGEDSGSLPEALLRIADYRAKQDEMYSRFRMAMAYPILMGLVGVGTIVFMLTFVMPRLAKIFAGMGENLPIPTRILIATSTGMKQWWPWIAIVIVSAVFIIRAEMKTKAGRLAVSMFKLHIPIVGKLTLKSELARFSRTLELLIKNGVSILKAIDVAIPVLENEVIVNQLRKSYKDLEQGGSLGRSLKGSKIFPLFMTNLLVVGEESGRLEESLAEVADSYERDTDEAIRTLASLLEPLMILVMGLIVGFIVMAMLLPIFEINVMVK